VEPIIHFIHFKVEGALSYPSGHHPCLFNPAIGNVAEKSQRDVKGVFVHGATSPQAAAGFRGLLQGIRHKRIWPQRKENPAVSLFGIDGIGLDCCHGQIVRTRMKKLP